MTFGCIYVITNAVNDKCYIGQTKKLLVERFSGHVRDALNGKSDTCVAHAIRKYGVESFDIEILEECDTQEQLNGREEHWIAKFGTFPPSKGNGYNMTSGGRCFEMSEEVKRKLSKANKGQPSQFKGKSHTKAARRKMSEASKGRKHSLETRRKMSESRRGKNNAFHGRKHKPETIERMKEKLRTRWREEDNPFKGRKHTKESKQKMSNAHAGFQHTEAAKRKISEGMKRYRAQQRQQCQLREDAEL